MKALLSVSKAPALGPPSCVAPSRGRRLAQDVSDGSRLVMLDARARGWNLTLVMATSDLKVAALSEIEASTSRDLEGRIQLNRERNHLLRLANSSKQQQQP